MVDYAATLDNTPVPVVNRVKYLGCYFNSPSAEADLSVSLGKFLLLFNSIWNVLGYNRNKPLAVHLVKTYCLPIILYNSEIWSMSGATHKSLSVAWNNAFRRIFNTCWRESTRSLQFYCSCLPIAFLVDQRKLLFWKKMMTSNNALLMILARMAQSQMFALASKYGITQLFLCSINFVKNRVLVHLPALFYEFMT